MSDNPILSGLTKKVGPAPAYVWGALIVGGVVVLWYLRQRFSQDGEEVAATDQGFGYPGDLYGLGEQTGYYSAGDVAGEPTLPPNTSVSPSTNPQWLRLATDALVALGTYNPTIVYSALAKVLNGLPITEQEEAIWNQAVRNYRQPPESYPPIEVIRTPVPTTTPTPIPTTTPTPTPMPTPAPSSTPHNLWVTVVRFTTSNPPWASTIWGIANHYGYGNNWGIVWNHPNNAALRARRSNEPRNIQPGDRVYVP